MCEVCFSKFLSLITVQVLIMILPSVCSFGFGNSRIDLARWRDEHSEELQNLPLNEYDLRAFMGNPKWENGILQKFVPPMFSQNEIIIATWTPFAVIVERWRNQHSLDDLKVSRANRVITEENPNCSELAVGPQVRAQIKKFCEALTKDFVRLEKIEVKRMVLHFKVDCFKKAVWLLQATAFDVGSVTMSQVKFTPDSLIPNDPQILYHLQLSRLENHPTQRQIEASGAERQIQRLLTHAGLPRMRSSSHAKRNSTLSAMGSSARMMFLAHLKNSSSEIERRIRRKSTAVRPLSAPDKTVTQKVRHPSVTAALNEPEALLMEPEIVSLARTLGVSIDGRHVEIQDHRTISPRHRVAKNKESSQGAIYVIATM